MKWAALPQARALNQRLSALAIGVSGLAVLWISLYLVALLRLTTAQWAGFVQTVGALFVLLGIVAARANRRASEPLLRCLERSAAGEARPEDLRAGFAAASDLPRRAFVQGCLCWSLGGAFVVLGMWLRFESFRSFTATLMLTAAISGGLMATVFHSLGMPRDLHFNDQTGRPVPMINNGRVIEGMA